MPVLIALVEKTSRPILELGTGVFSTPYLHRKCHLTGRRLVSYENKWEYFTFADQYADPRFHQVTLAEDWSQYSAAIADCHWSIALIDHDPPQRRIEDVKLLANVADFLILHDSEQANAHLYHYDEIYGLFRNRFDYTQAGEPHTTVVGNGDPVLFNACLAQLMGQG